MDTLLPYLQAHRLVTLDEEYHLNSRAHSTYKKSQMLMDYLKRKGHGIIESVEPFATGIKMKSRD